MRRKLKWSTILLCLLLLAIHLPFKDAAASSFVTVTGQFRQTEARSQLDLINQFRTRGGPNGFTTGEETWYWNSDNSTKATYPNGMNALTYDYTLEQVAMQRAVELAVSFSHTRPNGSSCFTAYPSGYNWKGENIAMGNWIGSAESAYLLFREDGYSYSGQGHRRNMLDTHYTAVGIACFYYNGNYYWAQEFGSPNSGASYMSPNNGTTAVQVEIQDGGSTQELAPKITGGSYMTGGYVGCTVEFELYVEGGETFQWYSLAPRSSTWNKVSESSGKTAQYSFTLERKHHGYRFKCIVSNQFGSTESRVFTMTVMGEPPVVLDQPQNVNLNVGELAEFNCNALCYDDITYQWQWSADGTTWNNCSSSGYNTATFSFTMASAFNGRKYRCIMSSIAGSTTSSAATVTLPTKPAITTQPKSVTAAANTTVKLTVAATGTGLQYKWQWSKDGTTWNNCSSGGYNTATFSFTMSSIFNGRKYRCVVSNTAGSTTSSVATVTLLTKPAITTQPKSVTAAANTTVKLTVAATGTGLQYKWQWSKDGTTWNNCSSSGYNTATFSFTMASAFNGRKYRCVVSNTAGSVNSNTATVTLPTKPAITTQPKSITAAANTTVKLTVAATGTGLQYKWQWSKDGTTWNNCSSGGYNTATFSFTMASAFNGRKYRCVVSNAAGSTTSSVATVTLLTKPAITTQPKSVTAAANTTVKLTVAATGTGLQYKWQWSKDGSTWNNCSSSGYNTATFSFTMASTFNGRKYRCIVSNSAGSVNSNAATVTLLSKPTITTQPKSVTAAVGATAKLTVVASGTGLKYQWQWSKDGTTWNNCSSGGYNTATFSFTMTSTFNGRKYRCVVSNTAGSTTSSVATVTVK